MTPEISLYEFVDAKKKELDEFKYYWEVKRKANPQGYPSTFDKDDWLLQLKAWNYLK